MKRFALAVVAMVAVGGLWVGRAAGAEAVISVDGGKAKAISPDLFGIFFEDLNFAADGGLYPEMIANRSFEYSALDRPDWGPLTSWDLVQRGGGKGTVSLDNSEPVHPNNPQCAVLEVLSPGEGVGLMNSGFDGFSVVEGQTYDFSVFVRHLFTGRRWGPKGPGYPVTTGADWLVARIESKEGEVLAEAKLGSAGRAWTKLVAELVPSRTEKDARLVLLMKAEGGVAIDQVSLFPRKTFKNRPNGLRADLAEAIAELKPKFVRFPGGCLVHGHGLPNMYKWKETIGPVEERKGQANLWRYHQSVGLGFFEYFQFCEDIGARPLPVLPAGVCCQNSGFTGGTGQRGVPMEEMGAVVQDVLDLIEYANGPADSTWGKKRAEAGHPEPFGLKYVGVGNEENITPVFEERFKLIADAVRAKHPEIVVVGTAGPAPSGDDWEKGWAFAEQEKVAVVDEHYYMPPQWFLGNLSRYDGYDRSKGKVYLGEYASRGNTLANAVAEAAYMTGLERNGDVVQFASYAPLLCKLGHVQWYPDMIYFTNTEIFRTTNYWVQQMFSLNSGSDYLETKVEGPVAASCVRDAGGDVILKLVNSGSEAVKTSVNIRGVNVGSVGERWSLSGEAGATNPGDPRAKGNVAEQAMEPVKSSFSAGDSFTTEVAPQSVTVLRMKAGK